MEDPIPIFKNKKLTDLEKSIRDHPAGKKLAPAAPAVPPKPVRNLKRVR